MNLSPRALELLAAQKQKYLRSLPQKHAKISRCWENIKSEGLSLKNMEQLRLQVHRLAGSAGSYGLQDLGSAAKDLDLVLGSEPRTSLNITDISATVVALLNVFDQLEFVNLAS